jgi:hypothetical protein
MKINDLNTLSEGLQYHVSNGLPLSENIFRPGSEEFFRLIEEVRSKFAEGKLELDWFDQELINTDIGTIVELANGEEVPLDIPFYEEEQLDEIGPALGVAAKWIIRWAIQKSAWPVLKWVLKKYWKQFAVGAVAYQAMQEGWDWVAGILGEEMTSMLIEHGFEIGMAVALIVAGVKLQKYFMKKGENLIAVNEALLEDEDIVNEIWGFAAGKSQPSWKRGKRKVPKEKFEPSLKDKLAARRKAAASGDKDAWKADTKLAANEAKYQGKDVELNKPKRGGSKKFYVYTKNKKGNVIKVSFGQQGMTVKTDDPGRVKAFVDRHDCKNKNDRTKASYWSCRLPRYKSLGIKGGQWW